MCSRTAVNVFARPKPTSRPALLNRSEFLFAGGTTACHATELVFLGTRNSPTLLQDFRWDCRTSGARALKNQRGSHVVLCIFRGEKPMTLDYQVDGSDKRQALQIETPLLVTRLPTRNPDCLISRKMAALFSKSPRLCGLNGDSPRFTAVSGDSPRPGWKPISEP